MVKKILVLARKTIKLIILLGISILLIICAVALFFKPIYGVTLNGEQIGYSKDKSKLQAKINKYMESGDGQSNVAFVQMEAMPEYKATEPLSYKYRQIQQLQRSLRTVSRSSWQGSGSEYPHSIQRCCRCLKAEC